MYPTAFFLSSRDQLFLTIVSLRIQSLSMLPTIDFKPLNTDYVNINNVAQVVGLEQDFAALFVLLAMLRGLKFLKLPVRKTYGDENSIQNSFGSPWTSKGILN